MNDPRRTILVYAGAAAMLAAGCERRSAQMQHDAPASTFVPEAAKRVVSDDVGGAARTRASEPAQPPAERGTQLAAMTAARKLVRTGHASVEVKGFRDGVQALERLAQALGGYVSDSQSQRDDRGHEYGTLTLRIPAEHFADALSGVSGLGVLLAQNVSAQDVTKAYSDLETRLRVKRDAAERLREILKSRTADLADVLQAEQALARVVEEIEQAEGERRFYDQQIALSTLTVELREPSAIVAGSTFASLRAALRESTEVLSRSVALMVYATSATLPWLILIWIAWRIFRARRRRLKAKAEAAKTAEA